jgi:acetylornithine/succinyldiaminopimelate/putrescine aminotransferase/choline dehydrogenase-like flavoprotein
MNAINTDSGFRERLEELLTSSDHLNKKHVHPKLAKLLDIGGFSTVFARAEGPYAWDLSGTRYLDFLAGGGVFFIGRNHPVVHHYLDTVLDRRTPTLNGVHASHLASLLTERLNILAGGEYPHTVYANSGTEASDIAVRFARQATRKSRFLYLEGAFHGRSCAAISMCGFPALKEGQDPVALFGTPVRPNDIAAIRRELSHGDVAGFMFEPLQGLTTLPLDPEYLREAARLCRQHGALVISDEVQTGLGRTGSWFRSRAAGITPDIITISKSLSGGAVPVSAALIHEDLWSRIRKGGIPFPSYDEPFSENDLAMAAGLATLDVLEDLDAPAESRRMGEILRTGMLDLAKKHDVIDHVVGDGLMMSVYFRDSARPALWAQQRLMSMADKTAFGASINVDLFGSEKVLVQVPGPGINAIKFLPPIVSTDNDLHDFIKAVDASLARCYTRQGPAVTLGKSLFSSIMRQAKTAVPEQWLPPAMRTEPTAPDAAPRLDAARIYEYGDYTGDIVERCDYLVIGSGPGGAIAARELAQTGKRVLVLEGGPVARREEFTDDAGKSLARWYYEGGTRTALGNVIMPTLQARCLGGGSVFNSAICLRATEDCLDKWQTDHGVEGVSPAELAPHYDAVEKLMGVRPTQPEVQGRRNEMFQEACNELGWTSEAIKRNENGCKGSGRCLLGCPNGAKLGTDARGIPDVVDAGGRVFTSVMVDRLIIRDGQVVGAEGRVSHPENRERSHKVTIHADKVIVAAGAINTPVLLRNSGINRAIVGGNLRFHPSGFHMGLFDDKVEPWKGATQGMHCLQFLDEGIKLESLWASPSILAIRFPGSGRTLKRHMANYDRVATWATWTSGESSSGTVRAMGGRARISYNLAEGDIRRLQEANAKLAEMFFAAGAKGVITGLNGSPAVLDDPSQVELIRQATFKASDFPTGSNHVFGTARMGTDPETSVCDHNGAVHGIGNLYVADGSLFPASPGVNPMLTIMALAHKIGAHIASA